MKKLLLGGILLLPQILFAQIRVSINPSSQGNSFPLVSSSGTASIYCDKVDYEVIAKTSKLFAEDIERVTGKHPLVSVPTSGQLARNIVLIGTLGKNPLIEKLVKTGKLRTDAIKGQWERFVIKP